MVKQKAVVVLMCLMLAACGSAVSKGRTETDYKTFWCETNAPDRSADSASSRAELDKINKHNRQGVAWCGWTSK